MAERSSFRRLWREYLKESLLHAQRDRSGAAHRLVRLAVACYDAGHQSLSGRCLRRAATLTENPSSIYSDLGQLYFERALYRRAQEAFVQAVDADPGNIEAMRGLAMSLQNLGEFDEATYYYLSVLAIERQDLDCRLNLGVIYHAQGRLDGAVEQFRLAMEADDSIAVTHFLLGRALHDRAEFEQAEASLEQAVTLDPTHSDAYFYLGTTQEALDRLEEAEANYRRAVELDPHDGYYLLRLAELEGDTGNNDAMIEHAIAALRLFTGSDSEPEQAARAYWSIGWGQYLKREWEESAAASRAALKIDPTLTPVRFNLGLALLRGGHQEQARQVYEEALKTLTDMWDLGKHGITDLEQALQEDPSIEGAAEILEMLRDKQGQMRAQTHQKLASETRDA